MKIKVELKVGEIGLLLTIIFCVLKIAGKITWSWFICFLPLILSAGIALIMGIAILIWFLKEK